MLINGIKHLRDVEAKKNALVKMFRNALFEKDSVDGVDIVHHMARFWSKVEKSLNA